MKIKVGGRYVARNGQLVEITGFIKSQPWPFKGSNGFTYTEDGRIGTKTDFGFDLMHEFKDEGAPSKLSTILTGLFWLALIIAMIGSWAWRQ